MVSTSSSSKFYHFFPGSNFSSGEDENGEEYRKPYTPLTSVNHLGSLDFLIKVYEKTEEYPNGGTMGRYLSTKKVGDSLTIEGPVGKAVYLGDGKMSL